LGVDPLSMGDVLGAAMSIIKWKDDVQPQLDNARDYWLGWGGDYRRDDDLTLYRSDVAHSQLNGVLRLQKGRAEDAMAEAERRLGGMPWMWWVGPDSRQGLAEELLAIGATSVGTLPVMAVQLDRVIGLDGPPELVVEEVSGPEALREWVQAYSPPFGVSANQIEAVARLEAERPGAPDSFLRLAGRINGQLVGTSMMVDLYGVAGIYVVAAAEEYRRRGIGAQLTAAALRAGQERGLRVGTLQASGAGAPLYRRMGFEKVAEYRLLEVQA
jgi:ribosomal protein S18 acetylase RimI-like enzyme